MSVKPIKSRVPIKDSDQPVQAATLQTDQSLYCPHEKALDPQFSIEHLVNSDQNARM